MIDSAVPIDTLSLFNLKQYVQKAGIQNTVLCSSIYLGYDLYQCHSCGAETIVTHPGSGQVRL